MSSLLKDEQIIKSFVSPQLTNEVLIKALNLGHVKNVCDIYCDIDFTFGNQRFAIDEYKVLICKQKSYPRRFDIEKFDKEILPFTDIEKLFTVSILDSASLKLAKETIEIYKSISTEIKKHRNETKKLKKELDDYSKQAIFYEITGLSPNLDDFIELLSSKEITEHKDLSKYDEETIADYNLLISQARRARVGNNKSTLKVKQLRELQISYNVTIEIKLDEVVSVFNDLSKEVRSLDSTQTFPSQQLDIISKLNSLILFFHKEMDNFSIVVVN